MTKVTAVSAKGRFGMPDMRPRTRALPISLAATRPRLAGWIVLGVGAAGLIWALSLDTSVSVGSPLLGVERVNNVGLMNQKQNLVIAFAVGAVIGVLLVVADYLKVRD